MPAKKKCLATKTKAPAVAAGNLAPLLENLRALIIESRRQAQRAVDTIQERTCWEVGRHIVEFEQVGAERAEYGAGLLRSLAEALTADFGWGFDSSNLRYMRLFYRTFPNCDALRHELRWARLPQLPKQANQTSWLVPYLSLTER